ncbi:MAG: hypothetical protein HY820_18845, partial [Acidobacteria bacterium]|nr:hypothetical protein [Acidobacteriota bacterium]
MYRILALLAVSAAALSAQTVKILGWNMSPADVSAYQAVTDRARIVPVTKANVMQELADADAFIGEITPAMVRAGKKLRWVQLRSAGVERVLHISGGTDLRDSKIVLTNNQVVQGPEIADHAMAMLLSLTRNIPQFIEMRKSGKWVANRANLLELNGRTAVVVGVGGIGFNIALRAWAHGMRVIGVDPDDNPLSPFVAKYVKPDQLDEVLPEA